MSKPRALVDLMTAVDAGLVAADVDVDSANFAARRRASYSRSWQSAPVASQTPPTSQSSTEASFEFSAAVSNSSASPASMVFSDAQLRAHQFPAVRSSVDGRQVASQVLRSSMTGSKKSVSFAADSARKTAAKTSGAQRKASGLLGCMGSACRLSRNEVVDPAMNTNRKVMSV